MKKNLILIVLLFTVTSIFAFTNDAVTNKTIIKNGISLGGVIAVVISWERNKSILFAIIHGLLSWLYVIYYYFFLKEN